MRTHAHSIVVVALLLAGPLFVGGFGVTTAAAPIATLFHAPRAASALTTNATAKPFDFVSNFEDKHLDGWKATSGTATVVAAPSYDGEPALSSAKGTSSFQIDIATKNFSTGDTAISFQAAIDYGAGGVGIVGLEVNGSVVASVGVNGVGATAMLVAGGVLNTTKNISAVPNGTAQPAGWAMVYANVYQSTNASGTFWLMDVYVDQTDVAAATRIPVPSAGAYQGGILETLCYSTEYSNIVYTTTPLAQTIKGYNNMDGYGQGSGNIVSLLPEYTTLEASMTLDNWSVPQSGILSFQINAMNRIGTTKNTCNGFFQLGVDLDTAGRIAPWFVPKGNCVAYYFNSNDTPKLSFGFATPNGSRLFLKIVDTPASHAITFSITDFGITGANHTVSAKIPYNGTPFFGSYTQIEWQPCCSRSPIASYWFNGSLDRLSIAGGNVTGTAHLNAQYMIPFALDLPPSWSYAYYDVARSGYQQTG